MMTPKTRLCLMFITLLPRLLFLRARALERRDHADRIAFVAGELVDWPLDVRHIDLRSPRPRPRRRLVHGELVFERVVGGTDEPLDQMQTIASVPVVERTVEVDGVDDERRAFPVAD